MEDWKIKISVLWLVLGLTILMEQIMGFLPPGSIEQVIAGEFLGIQITPELMLVLAIILLIPPVMAFLSLTLKDLINRWANIILGIVFAVLAPIGLSDFLAQLSAWAILIGVSQVVAMALVVWYAYKWKV